MHKVADAYRFLPTLGEMDLHLFPEGRHERLWEILGAHPRTFTTPDGDVDGVSFAVWAPNAKGVSLIGEFNHWDGNEAQLRVLGSSGVWELFWPGFERRALQVPGARRRRGGHRPRGPVRIRHRGAAADRIEGHHERVHGRTRSGWRGAPRRIRCSSR